MAETTREGFSKTMEYSTNQCQESQWKESKGSDNRGKTSNSWSLPADSRSHKLRRTLFTMEFLHKASNQESNTREAKELSHSEGGSFEEAVHDDGKKKKVPSTYDKYYIHNKKQQNREIHDRSLGLFNTSKTISTHVINVGGNERDGFRIEGERYENNERGKYCPNATRIRSLHVALGELRRISAVGSTTGTEREPCRFVHPHFHVRTGGSTEPVHKMPEGCGLNESCRCGGDSPMVIEVIANECERNVFASYINHGDCDVSNLNCIKPGSSLEDYVEEVQEYGFNHIILIGEREHGIIFLDCYGRLFTLDTMTGVLWPLGDNFEEAVKKPWTGELAWSVDEAGTIFEVEYYGVIRGDKEDQKPLKIEETRKKPKTNKGKKKKNKKKSILF
ncbi:hypothetical protein RhiirA4_454112 [Rhizophagus irregularis]|uniref:Uncharacterized protein n=1 Tax=Rhizophagus irregularis TaxID=588596 RepID=A0A2I1G218_9GLOM|nr:hypothetical protein RhiirA4_454112 [Rhizophagus irregularis]